ncbi:ribonuclease HIII [Pullulanibacillus pueri]|uniref:Ribonuclease HIII n=1 Tax=Pullulanibacillus pueri TaxID=1437324 RepID=A0A8J3EML7_9BACL|nr:ribonuclease HIII [Pullulanibacillus pueri]MBM7682012.1 ribonuclease HIII [Pullulanibacillus pueri]GGH83748.1 ribonuclease HIII [Pullulanibacillus pueri]
MSQAVIKLHQNDLKILQTRYQDVLSNKLPPGAVFRAETGGCAITAYKSGKVLFQGKDAEAEAAKWESLAPNDTKKKTPAPVLRKSVESHAYMPPQNIADLAIIGSDEVGTGDYFGPLVVAAVFTSKEDGDLLRSLGVRDSKALTDERIGKIAEEISQHVIYSILVLPNEKYNALQASGYNQNKLKAVLHNQALQNVQAKIDQPFDGFLIDQFTTPSNYFKLLSDRKMVINQKIFFKTKGESVHLSVACASILARHRFLQEMDLLSQKCGVLLPKGAGPHVDTVAARIIETQGEAALKKITKYHFGNTEKARKLVKR